MTSLITFTDDNMTIAAKICKESALQNNVDEVKIFGPKDIDQKFRKANAAILDQPRGCGYWLWKPYFIDRELSKMKEGDVLIYADAGVEFVNNINYAVDRTKDIFLFGNMYQHQHWCKGDIMKAVGIWPEGKQSQASVVIFRNTEVSRKFVKQWLDFCQQPGLIDDSPSKEPNHPEFRENRHDQAILTCMAYRDNILLHWWPAMYNAGNFTYEPDGYPDIYPVLFHHFRMRNSDFTATDDLNRHMQKYFKAKYPGIL